MICAIWGLIAVATASGTLGLPSGLSRDALMDLSGTGPDSMSTPGSQCSDDTGKRGPRIGKAKPICMARFHRSWMRHVPSACGSSGVVSLMRLTPVQELSLLRSIEVIRRERPPTLVTVPFRPQRGATPTGNVWPDQQTFWDDGGLADRAVMDRLLWVHGTPLRWLEASPGTSTHQSLVLVPPS